MTWAIFAQAFLDRFVPRSLREERRHQFENLTQEGISVAEYERLFYSLAHYAMVILPDEVEMIRKFMRGLKLRIREAVFAIAQFGASLQRVVESAKEFELMHREIYGDLRDKRSRTVGRFSGTSSVGRGSFRRDLSPQYNRPIQAVMQTTEGGY